MIALSSGLKKLLVAAGVFALTGFEGVFAAESVFRLNIPVSSAPNALSILADKTGHSLFFRTGELVRVKVNAVDGSFTLPEALDSLLEDTCLNAVVTKKRVIVVFVESERPCAEKVEEYDHVKAKKNVLASVTGQIVVMGGTARKAEQLLEEIHVTASYSGSLQRALDVKRDSNSFMDSIQAEDVGKFPEANLAEAMRRIPGIQLDGDRVTMRGLGSDFVQTSINGTAIGGRSTGFGKFPTDMFSAVEVYKSTRASTIEGGMAGTIVLKTAHPFDFDESVIKVTLEKSFSDSPGESKPKGSFFLSNTWNDTFGALLTVTRTESSSRNESTDPGGWTRGRVIGYDESLAWAGTPSFTHNTEAGNQTGLSDEELANSFFPRQPKSNQSVGTGQNLAAYAAFQWLPNENFDLNLELMRIKSESTNSSSQMRFRFDGTDGGAVQQANKGYLQLFDLVRDGTQVVSGVANGAVFRSFGSESESDSTFDVFSFNGSWQLRESIELEWLVSTNRGKSNSSSYDASFDSLQTAVAFNLTDTLVSVTPGIDLTDSSNFLLRDFSMTPVNWSEEVNDVAKLDLTFGDMDNNIRVGVMNHIYNRERMRTKFETGALLATYGPVTDTIVAEMMSVGIDITSLDSAELSMLTEAAYGAPFGRDMLSDDPGYSNWMTPDWDGLAAAGFFSDTVLASTFIDRGYVGFLEEDTLSAYIETNQKFQFLNREVSLNAGVRYIETTVSARNAVEDTTTNTGGELKYSEEEVTYTGITPSMTASMQLTDELILRMALGRSMSRPSPDDLTSKVKVDSLANVEKGNPDLEPYYADQFDVGLEWYFDEASVLALNYFYKDISGWIDRLTVQKPFVESGIEYDTLTPGQQSALGEDVNTLVDFNTTVNADDNIEVEGIELIYQQPLSVVYEGLGVEFSYSKLNYKGERTIQGFSENSYNMVTYFERGNFQTRVSYNYRDAYATCVIFCSDGETPLSQYNNGLGYLSYSASYTFTDVLGYEGHELRLNFTANNLFKETGGSYFTDGEVEWMTSSGYGGRSYILGLNASF